MEFGKDTETGAFVLTVGEAQLWMSREEAEQLFVDIGHTLQDDDITRFDENGETEEQPDG